LLIGARDVFAQAATAGRRDVEFREIASVAECGNGTAIPLLSVPGGRRSGRPRGTPTAAAGRLAARSIALAVKLCLTGELDAFVTAPLSKQSFRKAGYGVPGQTEFVAQLCRRTTYAMMLVAGRFRVGLATIHLPLRRVAASLSVAMLLERITVISRALRRDFAIPKPRIALLGLNPHSGEGGLLGSEEKEIIVPAIRRAIRDGIAVEGPFAADAFFGMHGERRYDAVIAMYHDQGLIPLKMQGFRVGVNFTAGLPVVRTSPDHGTAYEIAGRGIADASSIIEAALLAVGIARNRKTL
jgi:4-hydroxythreonine-4-phosphate dehydrogenase